MDICSSFKLKDAFRNANRLVPFGSLAHKWAASVDTILSRGEVFSLWSGF